MIWSVFMLASLYIFVPETYHPVLLRDRAISLRKSTGDPRYRAPIEKMTRSITQTVLWSCIRPFELLIFEPMLLFLGTFTALLLGILYLFFQAFPLVFANVHHFSLQQIGLTFLGLIVGMCLGVFTGSIWRKHYAHLVHKHNSISQPEFRPPRHRWQLARPHRALLVRLDNVSARSLDPASHRIGILRHGNATGIQRNIHLHGGSIPRIRRQRSRREFVRSQRLRCGFPAF